MTTGDDVMRDSYELLEALHELRMALPGTLTGKPLAAFARIEKAVAAMSRASKVTVDDAAVERAVKEYHGDCYISAADAQVHPRYARQRARQQRDMRAVLEAAFPAAPASEWNAAIEAAAKECDASAAHLDERSAAWDAVKYLAQAIRALSKKD